MAFVAVVGCAVRRVSAPGIALANAQMGQLVAGTAAALPDRRVLLTYLSDYPTGGYSLPDLITTGGYSLLGRRALLTQKADTPYPKGGYSFGDLPHSVRILLARLSGYY